MAQFVVHAATQWQTFVTADMSSRNDWALEKSTSREHIEQSRHDVGALQQCVNFSLISCSGSESHSFRLTAMLRLVIRRRRTSIEMREDTATTGGIDLV